jgi:phosphoenolpyruvate-protein phosphotransferase
MAVLQGIGVTRGIAIGPAFLYRPAELELPQRQTEGLIAEMARFEQAQERALSQIRQLQVAVPTALRVEAERMLQVQRLLLEDPALVDRARGAILEGQSAERAWHEAVETYLAIFSPIPAADLRAHVADLRDIGRRVLAAMLDIPMASPFDSAEGAILFVEMLTPSESLHLAAHSLAGLCLIGGTPTSPVAVVARSLDLPTVVGLGEELLDQVSSGDSVVVDGSTGLVEVKPDEETVVYYRERQALLRAVRPAFDVTAPVHTADGWRVDVRVDLDHPAGLIQALGRGAEGLGLIRTDFLFLGQRSEPDEEEQEALYRELLDQAPEGDLVFCTLSVGTEERLPFPGEPEVGNPLLGLRGVRLSLAYLSAFREQLRAILRAGAGRSLTVVFPMVETLAEVRAAREWLHRAQQDLENAAQDCAKEVAVGLLLQTPLSVLNLAALAEEASAFYLDLDRLTEYLLACDRRNLRVAHLFRPLHPVVLRMVKEAVAVVHHQGKRLEMCGESAGFPEAVLLLLGLGVDGFCLPAERIPGAKSLLRRLTVPEAKNLAELALKRTSAPEVEALVDDFLD